MFHNQKVWLGALMTVAFLQGEVFSAEGMGEERDLKPIPMTIQKVPFASAGMLIRKPIHEVFEAFVDPNITTKFWFTKSSASALDIPASSEMESVSSGRLEPGKLITWTWEMYGHSVQVNVKEIERDKRILIEWGNYKTLSTVEWEFKSLSDTTTFVSIINNGFKGNGDEMVEQAISSTGGFSWLLAGAKAYLEHGISLNLIADRFPEKVVK